eukprot:IDg22873t1
MESILPIPTLPPTRYYPTRYTSLSNISCAEAQHSGRHSGICTITKPAEHASHAASIRARHRHTDGAHYRRDKSKLRSRREARVHRVKEKTLERALKDAIRWLIAELP